MGDRHGVEYTPDFQRCSLRYRLFQQYSQPAELAQRGKVILDVFDAGLDATFILGMAYPSAVGWLRHSDRSGPHKWHSTSAHSGTLC